MHRNTRRFLLALAALMVPMMLIVWAQQGERLPAPTEDRVGFPEGYQDSFTLLFVFDRPDNRSIRYIYGNDLAASVGPGEAYPYGSVLVMDVYRSQRDEDGNVLLGENGRYVRGDLFGSFIQRKEPGFGEAYEANRSGEWEYAAYRPDGSVLIPPENTANCAQCHLQQAGAARDYVFRADLTLDDASGAVPQGLIQHYAFVPNNIVVEVGGTATWYNDDEVWHTVTSADGAFDSGVMAEGDSFSATFDETGVFRFVCSIHPAMTGQVVVIEPPQRFR